MRAEEERLNKEIDRVEWLRQAIIAYSPQPSVHNTEMRVHNLTLVSGCIAQLKRELYECQHMATH